MTATDTMLRFLFKWLINIIALFLVINMVAGVSVDSWESIIVAALVLGLLNAFLKPALIMLTLPFNILTLGVLTLFINGSLFYLAAKFVKGFHIVSFWNAFWASIIFSVISFFLNVLLTPSISIKTGSFYRMPPKSQPKDYDDVIDVEGRVEK